MKTSNNNNNKQEKKDNTTAISLINKHRSTFENQLVRKKDGFTGINLVGSFLDSAIDLIENDDKIKLCLNTEKGKKSLIESLKLGSALSLSLNPLLSLCCLVPYESKDGTITVSYQTQKNGLILLGKEQGWDITCLIVRENDTLEIEHTIDGDFFSLKKKLTNPGEIIGFLASGKNGNEKKCEYMSISEVVEHARRHASSRALKEIFFGIDETKDIMKQIDTVLRNTNLDWFIRQSSWLKSFPEMGLKTITKRLLSRPGVSVIIGSIVDRIESTQDQIIIKNKSEEIAEKIAEKTTEETEDII